MSQKGRDSPFLWKINFAKNRWGGVKLTSQTAFFVVQARPILFFGKSR